MKIVNIWRQRLSSLKIRPNIKGNLIRYRENPSMLGTILSCNIGPMYRRCFLGYRKKPSISQFSWLYWKKPRYQGRYRVQYGTQYCFDFWCLWQDRLMSCALLPIMPLTMGWMMVVQWMKMNVLTTQIKNLYHSLLQLECWDQWCSACWICLTLWH